MKLYDYVPEALLTQRIVEGYINVNFHKKFTNLAIYTYSKAAQFDYVWDEATCKCRGLIVDTATMEIIARPFAKFFNVGEQAGITRDQFPAGEPIITDKLDGNLITLYYWEGRWWAASKGSFHSEPADWANKWLKTTHSPNSWSRLNLWPVNYTPVFEMIAEDLEHHVVHYGSEASGLYLIALINTETGEELENTDRFSWAQRNDLPCIPLNTITLDEALRANEKNAEGYVLAWPRKGQTPVRVKVKFTDFLRLQKLFHHIGPKEILDYMRQPHLKCYLDEVLNPETSHPVFIAYTKQWMARFKGAYDAIETTCNIQMTGICKLLTIDAPRKDWADFIKKCQYPSIMFAILDEALATHSGDWSVEEQKARIARQIWKKVEPVAERPDDIRSLVTQEE